MADVDVVILVDEKRRGAIDEVAADLAKRGVTIKEKLPRFRTILGSGDSSRLHELNSVSGVEMVRPERKFQLPPMDEKIPQ
jgi:hypothetical protein